MFTLSVFTYSDFAGSVLMLSVLTESPLLDGVFPVGYSLLDLEEPSEEENLLLCKVLFSLGFDSFFYD